MQREKGETRIEGLIGRVTARTWKRKEYEEGQLTLHSILKAMWKPVTVKLPKICMIQKDSRWSHHIMGEILL